MYHISGSHGADLGAFITLHQLLFLCMKTSIMDTPLHGRACRWGLEKCNGLAGRGEEGLQISPVRLEVTSCMCLFLPSLKEYSP